MLWHAQELGADRIRNGSETDILIFFIEFGTNLDLNFFLESGSEAKPNLNILKIKILVYEFPFILTKLVKFLFLSDLNLKYDFKSEP